MSRTKTEIKVGKRTLTFSNLDKIFYPAAGFTKGDMVNYYREVAPLILPHLKDRAVTLKRYPNGADGMFFYEKRCPSHRPDWVTTASVWSEGNQDIINFCVINDLPTLLWAANLAVLEFHSYLAKSKDVLRPTSMAFDLDPGPPANIVDCSDVALLIRGMLESLGLQSFAKTSGSKGLQMYVPLNSAVTYDDTKSFARAVAELLERKYPKRIVSKMRKDLRKGKVFIDWSQNDDHKTTVCVYSLRAREHPTVSTPVTWGEVEALTRSRKADALRFTYDQTLKRGEKHGDLFAPVLKLKQKLPKLTTVKEDGK